MLRDLAFIDRGRPARTRGARGAGALALLLGAALALPSCGSKGAKAGFQMPPVPVEVADVTSQTVRDQLRALGSIESDDIVEVVSELDAVAVRIPFAEGQPVAKGDLIAQLDDREIRAAAERAEAQREQAASNAGRAQKLFEQNAISSQELDDARTALKVAEADEALAKARLAKTRIVAPFAGLIGRRRVSPGAYLRAGDVITELARVDEMKVGFSVPERYLGAIQVGREVEVATPAYPGETFAGRVSVVDPMVNPQTRTLQLVARIPNPGRRLRPGMSADVLLTFGQRAKALVIPDEAVFAEGNQNFVYVVRPDSTVARAQVQLGTRDSARVEVLSGVGAGARVVRAGHQKLYEGARIMPIAETMPADGGAAKPAASTAPAIKPRAAAGS